MRAREGACDHASNEIHFTSMCMGVCKHVWIDMAHA